MSDGFTYSCIITYPIVAESPESALCVLEELVNESIRTREEFTFGGHLLMYDVFVTWDDEKHTFYAPTFYTVDEYFEGVEKKAVGIDYESCCC